MSYVRVNWEDGQTALSAEHLNNIEDGIEEAMQKAQGNNDMWTFIRDLVYPVGKVITTADPLNTKEKVEAAFGGTWVAWGKGRVPVGVDPDDTSHLFDSAEKTGGSMNAVVVSHTHPFSANTGSAGTHNHYYSGTTSGDGQHSHNMGDIWSNGSGGGDAYTMSAMRSWKLRYTSVNGWHVHSYSGYTSNNGDHTHSVSGNTSSSGESGTNKNLQPYITCYMWKRTA